MRASKLKKPRIRWHPVGINACRLSFLLGFGQCLLKCELPITVLKTLQGGKEPLERMTKYQSN
jgi:hypothetical protein